MFLSTRLFSIKDCFTCHSFTPIPPKISVMARAVSIPVFVILEIFSLFPSNNFRYHRTSSSSISDTSAMGSPAPASAIFPDASMLPEASTM